MPDYSVIDLPQIIEMVFYPFKAYTRCPKDAFDLVVPVDEGVGVHTRFYMKEQGRAGILYFHGNGEVIYDYDNIAPAYNNLGINLILADYRGYGSSGGSPSFTNACQDAKVIFNSVKDELNKLGYLNKLWIMGRSLGSISALELAVLYPNQIEGLIIESGFANVVRVMKSLGIFPKEISTARFDQECLDMLKSITLPALVLHGSEDEIAPHQEAVYMYENLGSLNKKMITIPHAGHNDIMYLGLKKYFEAIKDFVF